VELENTAEQLRRTLITADFNWNTFRQWHLSDKQRRGYSPIEIAQVMRAYAFYQNNVLPAHRRLLREIALELAFAADSPEAATAAQPFVFFGPEPARVLFPDDLPVDVAAKVASYQTKRSALKKELYDAVHSHDGSAFAFLRSNPLKALGEKQAGRLAELDALAEEIRRGLSALPEGRPERSPLPPHLDERVARMMQRYLKAQRDAAAQIDAILAKSRDLPMQASYRFEGDGLKFVVVPTRGIRGGGGAGGPTGLQARIEAVRAQISAVADDYGRAVADLLNERESIRTEIGQALALTKGDAIDRALIAAMRVANQKENAKSFSDYRTAVFEPGLSPEQRRLLFDSVVQQLDLPLPRGEPQASRRADTW
jgi:Spy/CpxP family protein refolding chaperone